MAFPAKNPEKNIIVFLSLGIQPVSANLHRYWL